MRAAALAVLALALAGLVTGCGSKHSSKSGERHGTRVRLHIDAPPAGASRGMFTPIFHFARPFESGDGYIIWDDLPDKAVRYTYCVISPSRRPHTAWCTIVLSLPKGQIVFAGLNDHFDQGRFDSFPAVGGSGAYVGARGSYRALGGRRGGFIEVSLR
jgi:hypothetical protein